MIAKPEYKQSQNCFRTTAKQINKIADVSYERARQIEGKIPRVTSFSVAAKQTASFDAFLGSEKLACECLQPSDNIPNGKAASSQGLIVSTPIRSVPKNREESRHGVPAITGMHVTSAIGF